MRPCTPRVLVRAMRRAAGAVWSRRTTERAWINPAAQKCPRVLRPGSFVLTYLGALLTFLGAGGASRVKSAFRLRAPNCHSPFGTRVEHGYPIRPGRSFA